MTTSKDMNYTVGVDIGATFTDCVAVDEQGTVTLGKAYCRMIISPSARSPVSKAERELWR